MTTGWPKKRIPTLLPVTSPDVHNSFADRLAGKFAIKSTLNIPPYLTNVATLPCEISEFKQLQNSRTEA